ncbi:MAG: hypothetical protein M1267_02155 [Candidatus Thermoplasmatota archaeon]|nr:hypothetical protein [Candidatus Thermoplasmatota archaeon]MCL5800684.1 hypothetical protein [Candidatus Thermoplasmatota archaeon]
MKRSIKIAIPVVVVALVIVVGLGYFGYLPFLNSPHYGFPTSQQVSSAAGNGQTYNQSGSPSQHSGSPSNFNASGVSSFEILNYTDTAKLSYVEVLEIQFSSGSNAQSAYAKLTGTFRVGSLGISVSGNTTYRGFTYFSYGISGITVAAGFDSSYMFLILMVSGSAGQFSVSATSQVVVNAMYGI